MSLNPSNADSSLRRRGAIAVVTRGDQFLVIRRSAIVTAPRMYCFPGGGIELDETEPEALVREMREELGVDIRPLRRLWQSTTVRQVDLAWWHGELAKDAELKPNPDEVESIHWLTPSEMLGLTDLLDSNREFMHELARGAIVLGP